MINKIATERGDLFDPNIYINIIFDIIGGIDSEELIAAINKAFNGYEATMSKVVLSPEGDAYYEKMPLSGCSVKITNLDWDGLIRENEKSTFSIQTGELMRVFVKH